jgi:hypothetical protein
VAVEIAFLRRARGLHLHQPSEDGAAGFQIRFRHMAMGTLPPISDQLVGSITPNLRSCPFEQRYSVISEAKSAGVGTTLRSRFRAFYPHEVCVPSCLAMDDVEDQETPFQEMDAHQLAAQTAWVRLFLRELRKRGYALEDRCDLGGLAATPCENEVRDRLGTK